jgi:hypothetical protein
MVVAVVYAVDVSTSTSPLSIAYPSLGEGRYLDANGIQTVAEVEVLYPMLNCCHDSIDVLVLTDGGRGAVIPT